MQKRKNQKKRVSFIIVVLLIVVLIAASFFARDKLTPTEGAATDAASTVSGVFYRITSAGGRVFNRIFGAGSMRRENEELKVQNAKLKEELMLLQNLKVNESAINAQYALREKLKASAMEANVTGMDPGSAFVRFTVNRGVKDGVSVGDIVIMGSGVGEDVVLSALVGRVISVGAHNAKVSSIIDDANNISFKVARTNDFGIANEHSTGGVAGYLFSPDANILVGDYVLTSGMGEVYPKGLYIGDIQSIDKKENQLTTSVSIKSPVNFRALDSVFILPKDAFVPDDIDFEKLPRREKAQTPDANKTPGSSENTTPAPTEEKPSEETDVNPGGHEENAEQTP